MGSHKRAIDAYTEAEKISALPDWEIYYGLGKLYLKLYIYNIYLVWCISQVL